MSARIPSVRYDFSFSFRFEGLCQRTAGRPCCRGAFDAALEHADRRRC
jgi:hypothetical protein